MAASSGTSGKIRGGFVEQRGVTVLAEVKPGAGPAVLAVLDDIGRRVAATGEPYARSPTIHYARFVFIRSETDHDGRQLPASVMYLGDFDGEVDDHLAELATLAAGDLERIGAFLVEPMPGSVEGRKEWLAAHVIPNANYYVNTIGRTVAQIRQDAALRTAVEDFLDTPGLPADDPEALREATRVFVASHPDLRPALNPLPSDAGWKRERFFALVLGFGIGIPVAILLLPVAAVWTLVLRWHERRDPGDPPVPDPAHVAELADQEDRTLQNQFSALGFVKPGWFRLATATVLLTVGRWGTRYLFPREDLAGVKTIHFARWTFIDGKRRMMFASNYDGSLENYMGDFIDIVAWGLNAIFSNGVGYPRTRFLILDGAWNEASFKRHIRNRQIPSQVWYCAYPNLSALAIAGNARLRADLSAPANAAKPGIDWLRLLRRNWGRPKPRNETLEREDMQALLVRGHSSHPAAAFLLLALPGDRTAARTWLKALPVANGSSERSDTYVHVAFTRSGLERLGCPAEALAGFSHEYRTGMTTPHRRRILGDDGASAPEHWDWGGDGDEPHVLLLAYARNAGALAALVETLRAGLVDHGVTELRRLDTETLKLDGDRFGREHFGFNDGLTTPPIAGLTKSDDPDSAIRPGEFFLGYENEYGRVTPRPLLPPALDPERLLPDDSEGSGARDLGRNGTYLVFRQLAQDVHAFWSAVEAHANGGGEPERIRLASKMVGRWPGGAPLTVSPERDDPAIALADFAFHDEDRDGQRCPVGAHIRRTNPRDSLEPRPGTAESVAVNKRHRLLRRGRAYGPPLAASMTPTDVLANGDDGRERGLHFICLTANIARQFEFIQASWANNPSFAGLVDDVDPLIGRRGRFTHPDADGATATFTAPDGAGRQRLRGLPDFITVKGGAYFFMPGMRALRYLAEGPPG